MSSNPSSDSTNTGSLTGTLKGMFKSFSSAGVGAPTAPAPIKTKAPATAGIGRQDSMPELVGTPSDIGIWETSHELKDANGKFTWKRLFQDPRTYRQDLSPQAPVSPKK